MKPVDKKINDSFKKFIKSFVSIFASREFAFVYCLIGTFGQITHCYFLLYSVSSFTGWFRSLQAILLSVFISSSLLYFVSIADKDDEEHEYKRIIRAINMFMVIEIAINLYYYAQNLLIQSTQLRVFDFIFAIVISGLLPITIKLYANSIKAKEWLKEFDKPIETPEGLVVDDDYNKALKQTIESTARDISNEIFKKHKTDLLMEIHKMKNDENSSYNFDRDGLNNYIEEQIVQKIKEIPESEIDDEKIKQIKDSILEVVDQKIKENMNMFLKQFDNKVDYRIRQYGIKAKNEQFSDNK